MTELLRLPVGLLSTAFAFLAFGGCTLTKPPQTAFYCLDVPTGRVGDVRRLVDATAKRLNFKVSEGTFPFSANNIHHAFEVYGKGISLFVNSAITDDGNANAKVYSVQVVKTGWWQRARFDDVLGAFATEARSAGLRFARSPDENACSDGMGANPGSQ